MREFNSLTAYKRYLKSVFIAFLSHHITYMWISWRKDKFLKKLNDWGLKNLDAIEIKANRWYIIQYNNSLLTSKGGNALLDVLTNCCSKYLSRFSRACRMRARRNCERAATMAMCASILVSSSPTMNSTSQKRDRLSSLPKSSCNVHLGYEENWKRYISAERMLLSTVPPKMNIASPITAAAWKSRPGGTYMSALEK